ncbi:unnamed protein product, partial [Darwinula stevensoni]
SYKGDAVQAVKCAIDIGYRHVDTAYLYENEREVGEAVHEKIKDGTVKREDIFILWNTHHPKNSVLKALKNQLAALKMDYVDLYLIHWPMHEGDDFPNDKDEKLICTDNLVDTWKGMEECVAKGLTKSIGISNFNSQQVDRILSQAKIPPVVNQVECHPWLNQEKLLAHHKKHGIVLTAYSPLGSPGRLPVDKNRPVLMKDPTILALAEKYSKTPAQFLIRYQLQRGIVCIPKSRTPERIKSNFEVFDFDIASEDMETLNTLGILHKYRYCTFDSKQSSCQMDFTCLWLAWELGSSEGEAAEAVKYAINVGYRHVDTASVYENEKEVGEAVHEKIKDGTVKREDIFILWNTHHHRNSVLKALKNQLAALKMDYVDLYLIHWPMSFKEGDDFFPSGKNGKIMYTNDDIVDTWKGMEECVEKGLAKSIGISNFNSQQVDRILSQAKIPPVVNQVQTQYSMYKRQQNKNIWIWRSLEHHPVTFEPKQVECHPWLNQEKLLAHHKKHGIVLTAYSPLGSPARPWVNKNDPVLLKDPTILALAEKYSKTPAQLLIRYQASIVCIPKSQKPERIEANLEVFDFEIASEDMKTLNSLESQQKFRYCPFDSAKDHPQWPFKVEF